MSNRSSSTGATARVSITINAEPATVWRFLAEGDKVLAWMTFIPGAPPPAGSTFEPHPGGKLRILFPNGGEAHGEVVEIDPPRRIVFTWGYDPDVAGTGLGAGACRVEISLFPIAEGTRVTLTHTGPMSEGLARDHEAGWRHYLSQLAVHTTRDSLDSHLVETLGAYFAACNQPDDAARQSLLDACVEPDIRVRTPFACSDTLGDFSRHITNGLRHMPGAVSSLDGEVRHIHGVARVPWVVTMPGDRVAFRGENFVRFSPRGKIAEIVSFHA